MIDLSAMAEAVDVAYAEGTPCLAATASPDGRPNIGFKGSMMVFDSDHLAFWDRTHGETLADLRENPRIAVIYRNPKRGHHWRFYGIAELHAEGDLRQQVMERTIQEELDKDPDGTGVAVVIRVDRVLQGRNLIQER
jgi:predicted pyridoxine 5'-phosphate oxidase superfamily flavin-nucleotide-binding protein